MSGTDWTPVHHEDLEEEPAPKPKPSAKPKPKANGKGEPALMLTIPPNMIAGLWSLSEALKENTEAARELTKELRAARESRSDGKV